MATPLEKSNSATPDAPKGGEDTRTDDHERDEIEFVDPLPEELKCSICLQVFQDPILTDCGHHFCQACIAPVVSKNRNCPLCNQEGFRTFPDKATGRKIKSLEIKCKKRVEGCEWVGEYGRLEHHLDAREGGCGFVEVECDFSSVGCTTRSLRKDLPQHMEANTHKHLIMMSVGSPKAGSETERQLQERRAELLQQQLQKKEEDMQRQITTLQKKEEETQRQIKKKEEETHQHILQLEGRLKEKDEQIKALQAQVFCFPPFEFTMPGFSKHKTADDEWLSPPFYSHPRGYKLRFAVYANGHDQYKGTQVSFVLYTMKGEYDDQLEWPKTVITWIYLLAHNTGKWDKDVGPGDNKPCMRPTAAQERQTNWCSIDNSSLGPYLKNDCIHCRVTGVRLI